MPKREGPYDSVRVDRPIGTKYAASYCLWIGSYNEQRTIWQAIAQAASAFFQEFGRNPVWDRTIVETVCTAARVHVTIFELEDDSRAKEVRKRDAKQWNQSVRAQSGRTPHPRSERGTCSDPVR